MIILAILAVSLLIALVRGGRPQALAQYRFSYLWLCFIPLALQLVIFTPLGSLLGGDELFSRIVYLISMCIAAVLLFLTRRVPGLTWVAIGLVLNFVVIAANGGLMPVSQQARQFAGMPVLDGPSNNVVPIADSTLLWWLADIIPLPSWMPFANVLSPGDVFIALGAVIFTQVALMPPLPRPAQTASP